MNKLMDHKNYVGNATGRKYVWGKVKFLGTFTSWDFLILFSTFIFFFPWFFFHSVDKVSLVISFISILFLEFILIAEVGGVKNYETCFELIVLLFSKKEKFKGKETLSVESDTYEVLSGIDAGNLNNKTIDLIENNLVDFMESINEGQVKIYKFNATLRLKEYLDDLQNKQLKEKDINKKLLLKSYSDNVDSFKRQNMFNVFIEFKNMDDHKKNSLLNKLNSIFEIQKLENEKWNALKLFVFDLEKEYKIKASSFSNGEKSFIASEIEWGRNIPSFFLQYLLFDPRISFVLDLKNPNFKEMAKIKKDLKAWSKRVMHEQNINAKDIKKFKDAKDANEAEDNILGDYLFGNTNIKFMAGHVFFEKDNNNPLSLKKQFSEFNWKLEKNLNFVLRPNLGEQKNYLMRCFGEEKIKIWYPVSASVLAYGLPFQNLTILEKGGVYMGTSDAIYPYVPDVWGKYKAKGNSMHTGIIARTGGGKSILMQLLLAGQIVTSDNSVHYVLDPKNSGFGDSILNRFGGKTINIKESSLNPLAFSKPLTKDDFENSVNDKSIEVQEFLYTLFGREVKFGEWGGTISGLADEIKKFYFSKKEQILKGEEFIFSDLLKFIKEKKYTYVLNKLIEGTYNRFNCKNNIPFDDKTSYVFDLLEIMNMDNEITNASLFLIMNMVMDQIFYRKNKNNNLSLIIDEAGDFLKSNYLLNKLEKLMVKSRSFKTKIIWATQNATDLIGDNNKKLASVLANTENLYLGQLKAGQIKELNDMFSGAEFNKISEPEREHIKESEMTTDKGKFLLINGNKRNLIKVDYENNFVIKSWIEETKARKGMN